MTAFDTGYSDFRYLQAKRTVDDRALNGYVMEAVRERLSRRPDGCRVLDLGGGTGTMIDRLLEKHILQRAVYTLVDVNEGHLRSARSSAPRWARGLALSPGDQGGSRDRAIDLDVVCMDMESYLDSESPGRRFDLILANAVLDLVDVSSVLPRLLARLDHDGTFWLTINFDGETIFLPEMDLDGPILAAYHRSMDARRRSGRPTGGSHCGRHLFGQLAAAGGEILAAGSSDWVVAGRGGDYPADEAYFLHHIVGTIEEELASDPELTGKLEPWGAERHAQIREGRLVYIAHQLDFAGTATPRKIS